MIHKYFLAFTLIFLVGCTDNQICDPLDAFNCCDPGLDPFCAERFGTFSSNQTTLGQGFFGTNSFFHKASIARQIVDSSGLSGAWNVTLRKQGGSCIGAPEELNGVGAVTQNKRRVVVTIPSLGTYRGRTTNEGFSASGSYFKPRSFCFGNANLRFSNIQSSMASVNGTASVKCLGIKRCTVNYVGTATR